MPNEIKWNMWVWSCDIKWNDWMPSEICDTMWKMKSSQMKFVSLKCQK